MNAFQAKNPPGTYSDDDMAAMEHAGHTIKTLDGMIDGLEARSDRSNSAPAMPALRNAADFKHHYRADNQFGGGDEDLGLLPFMRGVAGAKTTSAVQNTLSVGSDTAGGYLVPSITQARILKAFAPASACMQAGAAVVPLETGAKSVTLSAISTLPQAAWRLESGNCRCAKVFGRDDQE